jgi:release factor glutamine methyltransferase
LTIAEVIAAAAGRLSAQGIEDAWLDAEVLLGHVLGRERAWLVAHYPDRFEDPLRLPYEQVIARRAKREPLQYIIGMQEFWGIPFTVTPDVLIPRPETELVVEEALRRNVKVPAPLIVDLCTGSGCIAVSLAKELPEARIFATDRSAAALDIARENARRNGVADRIRCIEGDLFGPLDELDLGERIDIITANPPYVRDGERPGLQPEVRNFEPELALFAGPKGTEVAERIIGGAPRYLRTGGSLIMEMGIGQAATLRTMVEKISSYRAPCILKDLAGIERVIVAEKQY